MENETERFQKNSLEEVKKANTKLVKKLILQYSGVEEKFISKLITFGELICNR